MGWGARRAGLRWTSGARPRSRFWRAPTASRCVADTAVASRRRCALASMNERRFARVLSGTRPHPDATSPGSAVCLALWGPGALQTCCMEGGKEPPGGLTMLLWHPSDQEGLIEGCERRYKNSKIYAIGRLGIKVRAAAQLKHCVSSAQIRWGNRLMSKLGPTRPERAGAVQRCGASHAGRADWGDDGTRRCAATSHTLRSNRSGCSAAIGNAPALPARSIVRRTTGWWSELTSHKRDGWTPTPNWLACM
jgi:hypothetical protein